MRSFTCHICNRTIENQSAYINCLKPAPKATENNEYTFDVMYTMCKECAEKSDGYVEIKENSNA